MPAIHGWSTQQLTEFLVSVSHLPDESRALRTALERAAEAVEAEVGAILLEGHLAVAVGFGTDDVPLALLDAASNGHATVELPGVGTGQIVALRFEEVLDGTLVLVRAGDTPFASEERGLLRGMCRILTQSVRMLRLLEAERLARQASESQTAELAERQRLLEAVGDVQRLISRRAPQQQTLDAITRTAGALISDEMVALRVLDPDDPAMMVVVSESGVHPDGTGFGARTPVGSGAGGRAVAEERLVVIHDYQSHPAAMPGFVEAGLQAAIAAPVYQDGHLSGSLVVSSRRVGRSYGETERHALITMAELASLALTDAARTRQMLHSALHDSLTGLPNRELFLDRLQQRLGGRRRKRRPPAVLFLDLDQLKHVNDSLGHLEGDRVLIGVARRLELTMRPTDTVARISGDEFAILVDEVDGEAGAEIVADRVLEAVRQPLALTGQSLIVSASLGIRVADDRADDAQSVMRGADLAMYEAKSRGRGRWERYHRALDEHAQRRLELERELRTGIERGEFRLVYQPVVSLRTGQMVGVEALLRWYHPNRGVISPLEFIGLAEETGLIVSLGDQVLRDAVRQLAEWDRSHAHQPLHMSINLSARQLHNPAFVASVGEILRSNGLQPGRVTLEITESVLMEDGTVAVEQLSALRALGVNIAIDDFGTGYSSLSYLQRLPVDSVKIDRSFVRDVASGDRAAAFVKAIVQMCRTIELKTVAEGVETAEQATVLRTLGCELAQGFLFAQPLEPAGIERRMIVPSPSHRDIGRRARRAIDPRPATALGA